MPPILCHCIYTYIHYLPSHLSFFALPTLPSLRVVADLLTQAWSKSSLCQSHQSRHKASKVDKHPQADDHGLSKHDSLYGCLQLRQAMQLEHCIFIAPSDSRIWYFPFRDVAQSYDLFTRLPQRTRSYANTSHSSISISRLPQDHVTSDAKSYVD